MEETNPTNHKPASSAQVPLKINFSNRLQTPHPPAPQIGRSPTLGASRRRQMLSNQRRFSVSCGSPSLDSNTDPALQKTNVVESPIRSKSPLSSSKIDPPASAPMSSAYVERGEARRAREFNHKISFDALHQHYRAGGRAQNEPKMALNFLPTSNSSSPSPPGSLSTPRSLGSLSQIPIQRWSVNQVCYWLKEVHLETHIDAFRRNDVNGEVLLELNHQILKQMAVNTVGPRVRLLQAVKMLCRATFLDGRTDVITKDRTPTRPSAVSGALQGLLNKPIKSSTSSPSLRQDPVGISQNMRNGMLLGESPSFCPLTPASAQPLYSSNRFPRSSPPHSPPDMKPNGSPHHTNKTPPEKDIMSLDLVQRNCVRVVGEGGQSRVVDVQNSLHHPQAILAKVLSKFSLPGPPSDYAIFVGTGEQTRMLSDTELMEICSSATHPSKDKFILRKRYSPPGSNARMQRWDRPAIAAGWDPVATVEPPVVAGEEVVISDTAGYRANRHSKLFTRRPDSKQIASNLAQYFPAQKLMARGSLPQPPTENVPVPSHRDSEPIPQALELPPPLDPVLVVEQDAVLDTSLDSVPEIEEPSIPEPFSPNRLSPLGSPSLLSPGLIESSRKSRVRVSMDMEGWIQGALIGAGSFGSVYLGLLPSCGDVFAVKQVELPEAASRSENRQKSDQVASLRSEIALMRELCHPNIVQYLGSSSTDQHLNIFLEYVPGGSVVARLAERGPFSEGRARHYVRQILDGLEYLHSHNIIHRDIKGGNVLIDDKDCAKIADFGVSKKVQDSVLSVITPHRVSLQGSVYWMAPEMVKQTHYTRKADIWSLGCLVIEMLTGDHPFPSFTQMQAIFKIGTYSAPDLPPQASTLTIDFLTATLNPKHELRPSSSELLTHPFVTDVPLPPPSPMYPNPPTDEESLVSPGLTSNPN